MMVDGKPQPTPDDGEGVTLSPDAPIGEPVPDQPEPPMREPAPGDGGTIAPGPTPESR
jgi:hypothetical protein